MIEENVGNGLELICPGTIFLDKTPIAQALKTINKCYLMKLKYFCKSKYTIIWTSSQNGKGIFTNSTYDGEIISKYKVPKNLRKHLSQLKIRVYV